MHTFIVDKLIFIQDDDNCQVTIEFDQVATLIGALQTVEPPSE